MKKRFLIWDSPKQAIIMLVVVLLIIGSINVFSATYIDCADPLEYFKKYWLNVVVSTFFGVLAYAMGYKRIINNGWIRELSLLGILLMLVVLFFKRHDPGWAINGAVRWIPLPFMSLQPSEFAKIEVILLAAYVLDRMRRHQQVVSFFTHNAEFWKLIGTTLLFSGLVLKQPDMGTASIIFGLTFLMVIMAGLPRKQLVLLLGSVAGLAACLALAAPYRLQRLKYWLDPWLDAGGAGYQGVQSQLAIGSGGLLNPSEYGDTSVNAGDIVVNAANKLTINGNIVINANPDAAAGNSISINKDNTKALVNITGDIYTNNGNEVHLSLGDGSAAAQNSNATGRQAGRSTLTGAILDAASTAENFSFNDTSFSTKGTNLNMKDAAWNVTADSEVAKVEMAGSSIIDLTQRNEATTVDMAGSSIINLTHDHGFQKLKINNLSGSGTIKMDYDDSRTSTDGSTADKLFINNHSGTHCLYLNEVNGATSLTGNAEGTVLVSVVNENGDFKAASDDNLTWNIYELNKKQSTTTGYNIDWYLAKNTNPTPAPQGPTRAEAATLKAHNMSYYLWRDQSERLTERLGITCFGEERAGVWTKMSNSSISGSGIYGSDAKVKTYTIGYDFKHNSDERLTAADAKKTRDFSGLAFTYIKGSSSMNGYQVNDTLQVAGGRSDIRGGALTAYHTHTSKSGSYADYVLRYSSYDNDFKLDGVNGSAKSHGLQASAEYGCRLENDHGLFVTPNAQFTLGRLYNKAFTTSNGVHVASDHLNSAILSMGVDVGQTLGDQSQVYAKVRYNTELGDRVSAAFYQGDASDFCNGDSNGSWWEYGLGFDLKAGHASHLFMDAERACGSGFSKDWSWRIGARFDF